MLRNVILVPLVPEKSCDPHEDSLLGVLHKPYTTLPEGSSGQAEEFYLRQISREVQVDQGAVQRELQRLADAGILLREARGREIYYRANGACPIFAELRGLALKTVGLGDVLRAALAPLHSSIDLAVVYGSQAAGTATAASDVDVLVVGTVEDIALHKAITQAEARLSRTVNYTLLSSQEFARRRRKRGGFAARVLASPTIVLMGRIDDD